MKDNYSSLVQAFLCISLSLSLSLNLFRKQRWTNILVCLMQRVWPFFPENDEKEKS